MEEQARRMGAKMVTTEVRDDSPESRLFAEKRGFVETAHDIQMVLELACFDDTPYTHIISGLAAQGFRFTTMEELGNDEVAQRKLFELNNTVSATQPGHEGVASWGSLDDFQHQVCQMGWYKPAGQFVVIDTSTGEWIAMSAITRFEDTDHAYNLFTGVAPLYRGRKLAQAVKVLALRYAREKLDVDRVRTNHNADNAPMIAIDHKLGYVPVIGTFRMQKILDK
jgi:RimJ/RimL family protein N-acetyltransferase